ncbi:MAG TPA: A24 family peptidase [Acidimicrobiales bacterium]|jgi:leader peptidase (prepilin peptidase)/N-methyltransferase|nr:A24 family peptidase [Acidimicrobiales bacterium]
MIVLGVVLAALLGVPAGMFANLLIDRVPEKQPLRPLPELRTLVRPPRYAVVVVATAALFAGAVLRFRDDWVVPAYLVFFLCLVTITVIDFQRQIIPNRIVYPTIFAAIPLLAFAALAGDEWARFGHALMGASLAWLALLLIHLISPSGMGFGDVRLSFVLGLYLGWINLAHVFTGLFLGVLLISVVGIVLAVLRLRSLQEHIAFGPFLAAGSILAVFAGHAVIRVWGG